MARLGHELEPERADLLVRRDIFFGHGVGQLEQRARVCIGARQTPIERPLQIHRGRPRLAQHVGGLLEVRVRLRGERHAVGGGDADGRRATHLHAPNGVGHLFGGAADHEGGLVWQARLVEQHEGVLVGVVLQAAHRHKCMQGTLHAPGGSQGERVKRRNVQEAFVGEPTSDPSQSLDNYADGDEAVDIEVRGGKIQMVVPAGTPDGDVFEAHTFLGGELELEDGRVLSFQIQDGAVGAQATVNAADRATEARASRASRRARWGLI